MSAAPPVDLDTTLARFGWQAFRPGQREVVETVLAGRDCLCVMPTGGGKSLCYQLPAVARPGLTLVISPLIALMKDQVDQLTRLGLSATYVNSAVEPAEQLRRLDDMASGRYALVYIAPERFRSPRLLEALRRCRMNLLAVDEAHCISEWGHDFRPDYARIGQFRARVGKPTTIALTATATAAVRRDIVQLLDLDDPAVFITGFARPNLFYEVQSVGSQKDKYERLIRFLQQTPGAGIVYASSRKRCEEVAETIAARTRRRTGIYHAGLGADERRAAQEAFMQGKVEVVVATLAFGMGIDKANVRFVVHFNLPGSVEAYYQEAGRAGRDGAPSRCLLLTTGGDRHIHEFFIESAYPSRDVVRRVYEFLLAQEEGHIEMTLQDIKESLGLEISSEGVGACEQLLEKAGVIERLEAVENKAALRIDSDLPSLVDLLPQQAKVKRRVLQAVERLLGPQRRDWVYVHPRELVALSGMDATALARGLRELGALKEFAYVPPFRGRAIHVRERGLPFEKLAIDFATLERRKAAEYEKLERMIAYARSRHCRQGEILRYFGEAGGNGCGHCDNCPAAPGDGAADQRAERRPPPAATDALVTIVRIVLSGVARASGRCGKQLLAQMLCGSADKKVKRNRLDKLSTFGLLAHLRQSDVTELLDALVAAELVAQVEIDRFRPVLELTPAGVAVMSGRQGLESLPLSAVLFERLRSSPPAEPRRAVDPAVRNVVSAPAAQVEPESFEVDSDQPTAAPVASNERPALAPPVAAPAPPEVQDRPTYYWTWRLLSAGFSREECMAIRGLQGEEVLDHAMRALDFGWPGELGWFVAPQLAQAIEATVGNDPAPRIRLLLAQLPAGTRYEQVQWYLKCRRAANA